MMTNILLCGGAGTRLWPISRKSSPKQFVRLVDEVSLFKQAILRNSLVCGGTIAVTNDVHYFQARRQAEEACAENARFVVEPCGRGTAAAIALACMGLDAQDIVLVTPSDHRIRGQSAYAAVMTRAAELADEGYIVTFGVVPTRPETGFGYIQAAGEEVVAFIVVRSDAELRESELDALCLENIARFKRPKAYRFVDELPKNNYGKILKTELRGLLDP